MDNYCSVKEVTHLFTSISILMNSSYRPRVLLVVLYCREPGVPACCTGVWTHGHLFFSWQLVCHEASIEEHLGEIHHEALQLNKRFEEGIAHKDLLHVCCIIGVTITSLLLMLCSFRHLTTATDTVE